MEVPDNHRMEAARQLFCAIMSPRRAAHSERFRLLNNASRELLEH
jgi:hypothetical protein